MKLLIKPLVKPWSLCLLFVSAAMGACSELTIENCKNVDGYLIGATGSPPSYYCTSDFTSFQKVPIIHIDDRQSYFSGISAGLNANNQLHLLGKYQERSNSQDSIVHFYSSDQGITWDQSQRSDSNIIYFKDPLAYVSTPEKPFALYLIQNHLGQEKYQLLTTERGANFVNIPNFQFRGLIRGSNYLFGWGYTDTPNVFHRIVYDFTTQTWTLTDSSATIYSAVAFGNDTLVSVSSASNNIRYSSDQGATWSANTAPAIVGLTFNLGTPFNNIVYNNGVFLVVGRYNTSNRGTMIRSTDDGQTWIEVESMKQTTDNTEINRIIVAGDHFFARVANSKTLKSSDGLTWSEITFPNNQGVLSAIVKL